MTYQVDDITRTLGAQSLQATYKGPIISFILDSRRILDASESLFFAIKGTRLNGHDFIEPAYQEGVRAFVISTESFPFRKFPEASFLLVKDALLAFQKMAQFHRQRFDLEVIAVTGSNGKTTVKEWLYQLLSPDFSVVRSPRSYNSQIGVPLSVFQINEGHQIGIFEAGISKPGEMASTARIIDCDMGVFTTLGSAHDEGFQSRKEKLQEKLLLFRSANIVFYNKDQALVRDAFEHYHGQTFSWSMEQEADLRIQQIQRLGRMSQIEAIYQGEALKLKIPFTTKAYLHNAILCWAILLYKGYTMDLIQRKMYRLDHLPMRLEIKEGINQNLVINDSYNNDLEALKIALALLNEHAIGKQKVVILSDFLETGLDTHELYSALADLLLQQQISQFIGVGKSIQHLSAFLPKTIQQKYYQDTEDCLKAYPFYQLQKSAILVKGARPFSFENITDKLAAKIHQTTLEVNLSAIVHNLHCYHQLLDDRTKMMVMVKAAGYGSGSVEVARLLEFHQVDYLAVAYADEGVELREAGIQLPIVVLNPDPSTFPTLLSFNLEPEVYSMAQLEALQAFSKETQSHLPIHINLDTGMHRLGFGANELSDLLDFIKQHPEMPVYSIFSHLAASDEVQHDDYTEEQYQNFIAWSQQILALLPNRPLLHILNSNGISRFPQYQLDMVRLGIGLYGIDTSKTLAISLRTVLSLKATISQIKALPPNASIGYGRHGRSTHPRRIATVGIGYADGLPRQLGQEKYHLLLHGQKVPIVGNVCMDMCMVDISEIAEAKEGDPIYIFGEDLPIEQMAQLENTISYEVLTRVSQRVKRVYIRD